MSTESGKTQSKIFYYSLTWRIWLLSRSLINMCCKSKFFLTCLRDRSAITSKSKGRNEFPVQYVFVYFFVFMLWLPISFIVLRWLIVANRLFSTKGREKKKKWRSQGKKKNSIMFHVQCTLLLLFLYSAWQRGVSFGCYNNNSQLF